ncbi:hypothetical protein HK414_04480 [Ramlibacter terrae]|uniref:Uncharacterized protein n=1 Tax=Ramlibacter terrae TaxID=2732511 RepID=A0ABX6P0N6_9BURK|nr:hypothetical protein HK414_04480 [Ramlibacter terrae]
MLELKVASDIFGCSSTEWRMWAEEAFAGSAHISEYLAAWKAGKRDAWKRLNTLAEHLRDATGDDRGEWESRLTRLEIAAHTEIHAVQPTSRAGMQPRPDDQSQPVGRPCWT